VVEENRRRKAANEAVFREVNERIEGLQRDFAATHDQLLLIVCECDRIDCTERLSVTIETYERVRGDASCFFVLPGHEDASVEDIVDTGGGYLVVRKRQGEARELAVESDPRS
jgi:hypothetical protein